MTQTLRACTHCDGFLPPAAAACPHCDAPIRAPRQRGLLGRALGAAFVFASGGIVATTLMACYGAPYGPPQPTDQDAGGTNGSGACAPGPEDQDGDCFSAELDCDDQNAEVFPSSPDRAGDQIDQNCDGVDGVAQASAR